MVKNPDVYTDTAEGLIRYASGIRENEEQELIKTEKLNPEKTKLFMDRAFETGEFKTTGTDFPKILPKNAPVWCYKECVCTHKETCRKATRGLYERFRPFLGAIADVKTFKKLVQFVYSFFELREHRLEDHAPAANVPPPYTLSG